MNLIRNILTIICILAYIASNGDAIFWMVDDSISLKGSVNYLILDVDGNVIKSGNAKDRTIFMTGNRYRFDATGYYSNDYYFAIELINYQDGMDYVSTVVNYRDIYASGAVRNAGLFNTDYYTFTGFHPVIPEPNSGMLVLFGVCILLLRRKFHASSSLT